MVTCNMYVLSLIHIFSVSGSAYGWKIDQAGEVAQLTQEIQSGAQTTREPVYSMRANSYEMCIRDRLLHRAKA